MGRMLDTLNQSAAAQRERPVLAVAPPPIRVIAADDRAAEAEPLDLAVAPLPVALVVEAEEPLADDDAGAAPFIEVGGPRSEVDASPEVLAFPAARRAPAPPAPAEPADDEELAVGGTSEIWCSWTLRPGVKAAK